MCASESRHKIAGLFDSIENGRVLHYVRRPGSGLPSKFVSPLSFLLLPFKASESASDTADGSGVLSHRAVDGSNSCHRSTVSTPSIEGDGSKVLWWI